MRNFLRKWLGIPDINLDLIMAFAKIQDINTYLDAREPCQICGHHRYIKENDV